MICKQWKLELWVKWKQKMFVKHYAPLSFFVTDVLYNLLLKQTETVLAHLTPVT